MTTPDTADDLIRAIIHIERPVWPILDRVESTLFRHGIEGLADWVFPTSLPRLPSMETLFTAVIILHVLEEFTVLTPGEGTHNDLLDICACGATGPVTTTASSTM
ncbi:hypothetical protein SODALDRAFT_326127 [Sodiomyces alkalinus F11]|uniref:Uncharacterized protein n=1 Tax=Sodiomyces alkalinus (strain CBS 110278 / VKM F-3762 / F11) TaxID=1314773 RepID=A0A3N2Q595_SODAK|nr:hypothetical protein SODALDRAFT_326127 [Sodiomyces alkalinus F11]ROT41949.1 hypothetical protein SODALDRAFT_326127 [Sodiomyces alkalinus F11]